eukprot:7328085-Pyramimonas_sp.AAC.1
MSPLFRKSHVSHGFPPVAHVPPAAHELVLYGPGEHDPSLQEVAHPHRPVVRVAHLQTAAPQVAGGSTLRVWSRSSPNQEPPARSGHRAGPLFTYEHAVTIMNA